VVDPGGPAALSAAAQVFVDDVESPVLSPDDAHHLGRVLRLDRGEPVVAADGAGRFRLCRYLPGPGPSSDGRKAAVLEADGTVLLEPSPSSEVTVGFVPVKGQRPEWVVQKLTELGVDRIVVLRSARAVVRWEGERQGRALTRLGRVAREAAAQSRRAWLPALEGVWELSQLAAALYPAPVGLADRSGGAPQAELRCLAVGPEGGWQETERAGELPLVALGKGVLRAETAALAAATVLCGLREGLLGPA
jgi:16S rRNA (uracil1498-N3)-methyltransferase